MSDYKAAMYQQDVMYEFSNQAKVIFYGPGFKGFEPNENIQTTIKKIGGIDFMIVGHSWLSDNPGTHIDSYPNLRIRDCLSKKYVILNKEYTNLEKKLQWIKDNSFNGGFTHHHDKNIYEKKTSIPFLFVPFAFDSKLFGVTTINFNKDIDFAFSGLLKNIYHDSSNQSDARILIMKKLFYTLGDIPLFLKKKYNNKNIFWNSIPRYPWQQKVAKLIRKYRYLNNKDYAKMVKRTKVYLNSLSPGGLVGARYFENMASKSLVFCEESEIVNKIFPKNCFVSYKKNMSDFEEKFEMAINDSFERNKIIDNAYELAITEHSWEIRVKSMIKFIQKNN